MTKDMVEELRRGVTIGSFVLHAKQVFPGRSVEEVNLGISLRRGAHEADLLSIKVFFGRKPYLRSWVEFFNIQDEILPGTDGFHYFGSVIEDKLLRSFSDQIEPGGKIFVEYYNDAETAYGLKSGFPPHTTRLGFMLLEMGFTWFKDWYFPEGFMEGGQKLQGEKPLTGEMKMRHLERVLDEINDFIEKNARVPTATTSYERNAVERAMKSLGAIRGHH